MKKIISLLLLACSIAACGPVKNVSPPSSVHFQMKGAEVRVYSQNGNLIKGELISANSTELILLHHRETSRVEHIPFKQISKADVILATTSESPRTISTWAVILPILSLGHGVFAIISAPINAAFAVSMGNDAAYGTYVVHFPIGGRYDEMNKFGRFPQGIPAGIDENRLE